MAKKEETMTKNGEVIIATFDSTTLGGAMKLSNADTQGGISLKNLDNGSSLLITDIAVIKSTTSEYGKEQDVEVSYFFGEDGLMYSSISDTVSMGAIGIAKVMNDFKVDKIMVNIEKKKNKSGDNEYITVGMSEVK